VTDRSPETGEAAQGLTRRERSPSPSTGSCWPCCTRLSHSQGLQHSTEKWSRKQRDRSHDWEDFSTSVRCRHIHRTCCSKGSQSQGL